MLKLLARVSIGLGLVACFLWLGMAALDRRDPDARLFARLLRPHSVALALEACDAG